jgi:hypothetical protein
MDRFCDAFKAWRRLASELAREIGRIEADLTELEKAVADHRAGIVRIEVSPPLAPAP